MDPPVVAPVEPTAVEAAIAASRLGDLPRVVIDGLSTGSRRVQIEAGTTIRPEGAPEPHLDLVVAGLVRVLVSAADGRTMTVRYCRAGALIGVPTLFADPVRPFAVQALTRTELLRLQPATARALAARDVRVARAFLTETSERVLSFVEELSGSAFATVRERVARHLLDLASERQRGHELVARVTQQALAEATGTVREVVVRVLRELREERIVRTGSQGIVVLDPERLFETAVGRGGTKVPDSPRPGG